MRHEISAKAQAIFAGHHHIKHHQMYGSLSEGFTGLSRIGGKARAKPLLAQIHTERLTDIARIINNQNMGLSLIVHRDCGLPKS